MCCSLLCCWVNAAKGAMVLCIYCVCVSVAARLLIWGGREGRLQTDYKPELPRIPELLVVTASVERFAREAKFDPAWKTRDSVVLNPADRQTGSILLRNDSIALQGGRNVCASSFLSSNQFFLHGCKFV